MLGVCLHGWWDVKNQELINSSPLLKPLHLNTKRFKQMLHLKHLGPLERKKSPLSNTTLIPWPIEQAWCLKSSAGKTSLGSPWRMSKPVLSPWWSPGWRRWWWTGCPVTAPTSDGQRRLHQWVSNLVFYVIIIIIMDNFCRALFSGVPKLTALYNILQHFLSFTNIIHIIKTTNNV